LEFCPNCGKEVLPTDRFCLSCGKTLGRTAQTPAPFAAPQPQAYAGQPQTTARPQKNPWLAAILNFFFPGLGYVYNGIGRDTAQLIFGVLVALSVALVFYVGFASAILSPSSGGTQTTTAADYVSFLYFLLPFAVAYDGYKRAKSA
jgi:hypothetical protein